MKTVGLNTRRAITFVEVTGSTNADMAAAIRDGQAPAEGDWIVALRQTAGKGRQGREWFDGAGNFMGSTIVALRESDPPPATLSFVSALAVQDAVNDALIGVSHSMLKWPNDVLLGEGKLSGILLEMVSGDVVVGIGVNLKRAPDLPDRKTAAISDCTMAPLVHDFAKALAVKFQKRLNEWREQGLATTLDEFVASSIHDSGSALTVHDADGSRITGTYACLDPTDGALRLRLADGSERVIRAGDVS